MPIEYTRFPPDLAARYRARGYWIDQPLTRALDAQVMANPDAVAVIDGPRQLTYAQIARQAAQLADRLRQRGLGPGDRAVVQLPNCAEFVIVFHALLRAGIAPVNAIFSHRQLEMTSYVQQLRPARDLGELSPGLFTRILNDLIINACRDGVVAHLSQGEKGDLMPHFYQSAGEGENRFFGSSTGQTINNH